MRAVNYRAAAALLVLLALGGGVAVAGDKAIDDVNAATFSFGTMAIGQAKDVDYARAEGLGLVPASPLDTYLNGVLAKLLAQSPVKGVPARVYVRASGDWAAKSTADANIYVALGALLRLDNEDEVAALLAHEASHIVLGHADADVVQSMQQRAIQLSALAAQAQDVIAGSGGDKPAQAGGGSVAGQVRVDEQSRALLINTMLISPAWTREQERDADRLGVDLLTRAGYSPQAMAALLRKQKSFESDRAASAAASIEKQLFGVDVNQQVQAQTEQAGRNIGGESGGALGSIAGAAIGKAFEWGSKKVNEVQRSHPKTEERIAEVEAYVVREYPDGTTTLQTETWEAAKEQDGTVDILENYIAAIEAKGKLSAGDATAAARLAKASLSGPTKAHAYPNYVDAAVKLVAGEPATAQAAYETAMSGPEPAGAIFAESSALYLDGGKTDKAVEIIEGGYARLQEPPSLAVPLIRTYRLAGRQADADHVAAVCAARWPKIQQLCIDEAKGIKSPPP